MHNYEFIIKEDYTRNSTNENKEHANRNFPAASGRALIVYAHGDLYSQIKPME